MRALAYWGPSDVRVVDKRDPVIEPAPIAHVVGPEQPLRAAAPSSLASLSVGVLAGSALIRRWR